MRVSRCADVGRGDWPRTLVGNGASFLEQRVRVGQQRTVHGGGIEIRVAAESLQQSLPMVAHIDGMNGGNAGRESAPEEAWPGYGLLVFLALAILVSLLAFFCVLYHTARLPEKLDGQRDDGAVVAELRVAEEATA